MAHGAEDPLTELETEVGMVKAKKVVRGVLPRMREEEFQDITPEEAAATRARQVRQWFDDHKPVTRARNNKTGG